MKATDLLKALRLVIREEVQRAFRENLNEISNHRPTQTVKKAPKQVFSGPLASLLEETANSMANSSRRGGDYHPSVSQDDEDMHLDHSDPTMAFVKNYKGVMQAADKHRS